MSLLALLVTTACGGEDDDSGQPAVRSKADAERAYFGLDASIDKAISLGFDGFNAASSANIDPQMTDGDKAGTLTVTGQVDQGSSANKGMRLAEALDHYSDDAKLEYTTDPGALPALTMKLSKIPNGTLAGTLEGSFNMSGELDGSVTLSLSFSGELQANTEDDTIVERQPGTTHITGSATSGDDSFAVDVMR